MPHFSILGDFLLWLAAAAFTPTLPLAEDLAALRACAGFAYRAAIRDVRERGEPTTLEELEAYYPNDPQIERATSFWMQAIDEAGINVPGFLEVPIVGRSEATKNAMRDEFGNLAGSSLLKAKKYLDKRRKLLALVRAARSAGTLARFPLQSDVTVQWNQAINSGLRQMHNDLCLATEVALSNGVADEQREALLDQLALGQCNKNEPLLMTQMQRSSPLRLAAVGIREAINRGDLSDDDLAKLQEAWADVDYLEPLRRALIGTRCSAALQATHPRPRQAMQDLSEANLWSSRLDAATAMVRFTDLIDGCDEDFPTASAAFERFRAKALKLDSRPLLNKVLFIRTIVESSQVYIGWGMMESNQCYIEVARASLACERYRRATGAWPAKLTDLVPTYAAEPPTDPIDGAPIRYRVEGKKAIVYSLDYNHVDDGGVRDLERGLFDFDVVFRLEPGSLAQQP